MQPYEILEYHVHKILQEEKAVFYHDQIITIKRIIFSNVVNHSPRLGIGLKKEARFPENPPAKAQYTL